MISLDDALCYPCCALEKDRSKLYRVSTHVGEKKESQPKLVTHVQKITEN